VPILLLLLLSSLYIKNTNVPFFFFSPQLLLLSSFLLHALVCPLLSFSFFFSVFFNILYEFIFSFLSFTRNYIKLTFFFLFFVFFLCYICFFYFILNFFVLDNCMNVVVWFVFHMKSILLDFSWIVFFNFVVQFQLNYFICC
jgi:hypothetical protein